MSLRHRPWKLLLALIAGTAGIVVGAADLLDGTTTLRGRVISMLDDPPRFFLFGAAILAASLFVVIGWIALRCEWNRDYRARAKPPIEDPDRTRPI